MATLASRTKELSGLHSGTLAAHLLAITQGTGTGVDRIIFASQMTVSLEDDQVSVIQRPSELSVSAACAQTEATQTDKPNRITAMTRPARVDVMTRQAAIYVAQKAHVSMFVRTLPNAVSARRKRSTTTITGESNDSYSV